MSLLTHVLRGGVLIVLLVPAVARSADDAARTLPLQRVVMFTSGIGYFEHGGTIEGSRQIEFKFNVDDVNDVLKSMVLEDAGDGSIAAITYAAKDPLSKTLRTFAIDLTREPTVAELLRQVRGEKVEVETRDSGETQKITGSILGIERRNLPGTNQAALTVDVLNLVTDTGLRSVAMDTIVSTRLLDRKLNADLQDALAVLALGHATDKKTVTLDFRGKQKRAVRVGYVLESPLWKTTYRLVLGDNGSPLLQGWAIVENTTEQDWDKVSMALVSGRPISFQMNLYQPFYVTRPTVGPEVYATVRSQTHGQDLAEQEAWFRQQARGGPMVAGQKPVRAAGNAMAGGMGGGMGGGGGGFGGGAFGGGGHFGGPPTPPAKPLDPGRGVVAAATTEDVGELFRYTIDEPVTLPRQKSAMLPILNDTIRGDRVSLYNPATHVKHPLNAVRLTNTTALHLMQGPITVFDGGEYAGDARIEDLAPKAERLVTYAIDLDVEVATDKRPSIQELVAVRIVKGTVVTTERQRREQRYVVKNSAAKPRQVLIELPVEPDWDLIRPEKASEQTRDRYRFAVDAAPEKAAALAVEEQHDMLSKQELAAVDETTLHVYLKSKVVSEKVKEAIAEFQRRTAVIHETSQRLARVISQLATINTEQTRLRENLKVLDRSKDSTLYLRYIRKFEDQENEVETLRKRQLEITIEETKLRLELVEYVARLNLD